MSFKINNSRQINIDDKFISLTPRTQKIVLNSWAKDFADIVFPAINEERFSVLYSDNDASRPNTPVNFIIGTCMLKELNGLTEDEIFEAICCDIRFQYALHTTSIPEQPISDRTISRFLERLRKHEERTGEDLLAIEMKELAQVFAKFLNLNSNIKRMDSMMIASNIKKMSRLEIIYTVVVNTLKLMERLGCYDIIPGEMSHYLDPDDYNKVIYHCKNEDVSSRLDSVVQDALTLKEILSSDEWHEFSEYQLLIRVLKEQTIKDEDGNITLKSKKDIDTTSLQNPSDPDATYRNKAGNDHKGYVANIVETVGENGVSLITDFSYEQNIHSDSSFCKEYLETRVEDDEPEILIVDGAYNSTDNVDLAKEKNVTLVPTALTGKQPDVIISEFVFSDDGKKVLECPAGHSPEKCSYYEKTEKCRIVFQKDYCSSCTNCDRCNVKHQKNTSAVTVSVKMSERAKQLKKLSTEEYKQLTKKRNAIEGIPSVLRRKYDVDTMPVRGLLRSKVLFTLKVGAYNIRKLIKHLPNIREQSVQNLVSA